MYQKIYHNTSHRPNMVFVNIHLSAFGKITLIHQGLAGWPARSICGRSLYQWDPWDWVYFLVQITIHPPKQTWFT